MPGGSDTAASFEFIEEDHTLGNALRHIIMKKYDHAVPWLHADSNFVVASPQVEFCGYSIPHPAEKKMNLRIQTYGKSTHSEHASLSRSEPELTRR